MGINLSQDDFKIDVLSNRAVALVSEFALVLYRHNGVLIDVDSKDVVLRVFKNSVQCDDRPLRQIRLHIKAELCLSIIKSKLSTDVV